MGSHEAKVLILKLANLFFKSSANFKPGLGTCRPDSHLRETVRQCKRTQV